MRCHIPSLFCLVFILGVLQSCAAGDVEHDHGEHEESIDHAIFEGMPEIKSDLVLIDVEDLIGSDLCSTQPALPLSIQIAEELSCEHPNLFQSIAHLDGLNFGPTAVPFLQVTAADALRTAVQQLGLNIRLSSTWRSVASQYVLHRWQGQCGIRMAVQPGESFHESGMAFDTPAYYLPEVRRTLERSGATWYCTSRTNGRVEGCRDPVHFTAQGGRDLRSDSVKAFQRLWNHHHPDDQIAQDGEWGPQTERRLKRAPLAGFPGGVSCTDASEDEGDSESDFTESMDEEPPADGPEGSDRF